MTATLVYLATPYTLYPHGPERAFIDAAKCSARLLLIGIHVYSPIVHFHPIAEHGKVKGSQEFWLELDEIMMARCDACVVAHMDGWDKSSGVVHEIAFFKAAGKPIYDLYIDTLDMVRR